MHVVVLTQGIVWYSYGNIDHKLLKLDYNTPKNQHPNVVEQNGEWNGLSIMLCPCKIYKWRRAKHPFSIDFFD